MAYPAYQKRIIIRFQNMTNKSNILNASKRYKIDHTQRTGSQNGIRLPKNNIGNCQTVEQQFSNSERKLFQT